MYAVALHNLAIEKEHVGMYGGALRCYRGALEAAMGHMPDPSLVARLQDAARQAQVRIMQKTPPQPRQPKLPPRRRPANPDIARRNQDALQQHVGRHAWVRDALYTKPPAVPHSPREPRGRTARPASARTDSRAPLLRPVPPPLRPATASATPRRRRSLSQPQRATPRQQRQPAAVVYIQGDEAVIGYLEQEAQPSLRPSKLDMSNLLQGLELGGNGTIDALTSRDSSSIQR